MPNERNVAALQTMLVQAAESPFDAVPPQLRGRVEQGVRQTVARVAQYERPRGAGTPDSDRG